MDTISVDYSGGAVADFHRTSLFSSDHIGRQHPNRTIFDF